MNSFWSKGRNRAVVYGLGALVLFGSYVIGAPDTGSRFRKRSPKKVKLEASVSRSEELQTDSPFVDQFQSENEQPVTPITPETVAIGPATMERPAQPSSISNDPLYPSTLYDPISDREVSEDLEKAIDKEMIRPSTQYPYEVSSEELKLAEQAEIRELTPAEKEKQVEFALSFGRFKSPPSTKKSATANSTLSSFENNSLTIGKRGLTPTSTYYNRALAISKPEDKTEKGEQKEGYQQGSVLEEDRIQYLNPNFFIIPATWNYTHEFLEVYEFKPGVNAGVIPGNWGKLGTNLFTKVKPEQNKLLHDKYRIPPDWDNRYKFSENQDEEVNLSTAAANKHLLSLGTNGSVTFIVRDGKLVNGDGADFVIWSHPFCFIRTDKTVQELNDGTRKNYQTYRPKNNRAIAGVENGVQCQTELAKVYVSSEGPDGEEWTEIEPCQKAGEPMSSRCAGYGINLWNQTPTPFDPMSGGDRYDLSEISMPAINAIKIVDLSNVGEFQKAGFDLDAIAMIHFSKNNKGSNLK